MLDIIKMGEAMFYLCFERIDLRLKFVALLVNLLLPYISMLFPQN
jgi:hypothetical protein